MKLRSIALAVAGFGLAGTFGLVVACSSSSSPAAPTPCNQNPWECTAGQTCWPQDLAGNFQCLNSGAARKGETCTNTVGSPSCADGLACLQLGGAAGFCAPFCDPANAAHACPAGEGCAIITLNGTTSSFKACVPTTPADAGTDANDTGTDTGSGVDAADTGTAGETGTDAGETGTDAGETGTDAAAGG